MERGTDRTADVVPATLEHEMRLINEAIALVASGRRAGPSSPGCNWVTSCCRRRSGWPTRPASGSCPLWHADEHGVDIAVEQRPA